MSIQDQIDSYIASQPEAKRLDMLALHRAIVGMMPGCRLWFLDGRDGAGKIVSNPNIGYGVQTTTLADGKTREFYQIGVSANTTGLSVYVLGIEDKTHLSRAYGPRLGKASVTGYCIKFKALKSIDMGVLAEAIRFGVAASGGHHAST